MSEYIVDITPENAQQLLIDESRNRPVVVDFWADWCGPCKSLMPILEKLANEYAGQFLLAKVNADEQAMLAGQFGVRSLPTVMVIKDGQPVDGFAGAQTEVQVREMLDKYLPKPWDAQLSEGLQRIEAERFKEAIDLLRPAYKDSHQRADIALALAQALLGAKRFPETEELLQSIALADQNTLYEQLKAQLELAQQAAKTPEVEALEKRYKENPQDLEIAYQLAVQYDQHGHHREALEILFVILIKDMNFNEGQAKKALMDILAVLGKGDPLAVEYQRKIYNLLY